MQSTDVPVHVWRVGLPGRLVASVVAGVPGVGAAVLWLVVAFRPTTEVVAQASAVTGVAVVYGLFVWWIVLRPRVVLTASELVVVNPWGTQRLSADDVVGVTPGIFGVRLLLRDGWSVTCHALSGPAGGPAGRRRARDVEDVLAARRPTT